MSNSSIRLDCSHPFQEVLLKNVRTNATNQRELYFIQNIMFLTISLLISSLDETIFQLNDFNLYLFYLFMRIHFSTKYKKKTLQICRGYSACGALFLKKIAKESLVVFSVTSMHIFLYYEIGALTNGGYDGITYGSLNIRISLYVCMLIFCANEYYLQKKSFFLKNWFRFRSVIVLKVILTTWTGRLVIV